RGGRSERQPGQARRGGARIFRRPAAGPLVVGLRDHHVAATQLSDVRPAQEAGDQCRRVQRQEQGAAGVPARQRSALVRGKQRYGTLSALNRQWGTDFSRWDFVIPMTTNEAMKRADENFSSWADHKEWMDISYARALKTGADAIRSVDPDARVGIGGAQTPGWG